MATIEKSDQQEFIIKLCKAYSSKDWIHDLHKSAFDAEWAGKLIEAAMLNANLSADQISQQSHSELENSLDKINNAIELANKRISDSPLLLQLLPILLERKNLIVDRIREIEKEEEIKRIVSQAEQASGVQLKEQLEKLLKVNEKWQGILSENEQERIKAQEELDKQTQEIARKREEREAFKEKWAIWKSLIEREPVSTIVGAILLIIITIAQIAASFTHITTNQILDNGFLVILGYFFGQTIAKASSRGKDKD